jgi:branched-chain amino acid aminotransferase
MKDNFVILNGQLILEKKAKISVLDRGFLYGDAIYETLRTINGKPWLLNEHLQRLRKSAKTLGISIPWTNTMLKNFILKLCNRNSGNFKKHCDFRIRITLSRGTKDFLTSNPTLLIQANKLKPFKKEIFQKGAKALTFKAERIFPHIKSTNMLSSIMALREAHKKNVFEAILINRDEEVKEGSISNIFIVKNKTLITPEKDILEGTLRNYIIKRVKQLKRQNKKLPVNFNLRTSRITLKMLYTADEIFITNSIKGIIPIVEVDKKKIGNGKPGVITQQTIQLLPKQLQAK